MKKVSLSSLSKKNLDKIQKGAIMGGTSCICAYICSSCHCNQYWGSETTNNVQSIDTADDMADHTRDQ